MRVEVDVRPHINIYIYIYTYLKSRLNTNITELARFARSLIIMIISGVGYIYLERGIYTVGSLYYAELKLCEVIYQHIVLFNLCYHHK